MKITSLQSLWQKTLNFTVDQSTLIKYHFIREQVTKGSLELKYCKAANMVVDIMTKGLTGECFEKLRMMTGLQPMMNILKVRRKPCS